MLTLHKLQTAVADAILNSTTHYVEHSIADLQRLPIYRNNIFIKHTAALKIVYPNIIKLVGEQFFNYAADAYISAHLVNSPSLNDFGQHFADFLATFPAAQHLSYLADVARVEWHSHQVYHAADHPHLDLAQLNTIPVAQHPQIKFQLHPASQLFASVFPILRIWQLCQPENTSHETINLAEGGVKLLITRRDYEVVLEPLTAGEYALLSAFTQQQNFAAACTHALSIEPEFNITHCLQHHIIHGTISSFS